MTPDAWEELAWLQQIFAAEYSGPGHVVREILPVDYPAYVRILHSFARASDTGSLRSWASMAAEIGFELHAETSHQTLMKAELATGPRQWVTQHGRLRASEQRALSGILAGVSGASEVYFGYLTSADAAGGLPEFTTAAPLDQLDDVRKQVGEEVGIRNGPDYWCPRGHAWVVCSDHDLASTYVACSEEVAKAIVAHPDLEALDVTPDTRIDFASDQPRPA
ncbi:hypothetical protein [Amycolatopsis rubida]|nr:hypothetical protein [Amycolatopsis rubida]